MRKSVEYTKKIVEQLDHVDYRLILSWVEI